MTDESIKDDLMVRIDGYVERFSIEHSGEGLIYLATPYSHECPATMIYRHDQAVALAAYFLSKQVHVLCPIAHSQQMAMRHLNHTNANWDFWRGISLNLVSRCDVVLVGQLDGWQDSTGVTAEVEFAKSKGIRVSYLGKDEICKAIDQVLEGADS